MKLVISGSRGFPLPDYVRLYVRQLPHGVEVVVGAKWTGNGWTPRGVDSWVAETATARKLKLTTFDPEWALCAEDCDPSPRHRKKRQDGSSYCPTAGLRRNDRMIEYGDALVAFWDGSSRGTKHAIDAAVAAKIPWGVVMPSKDPDCEVDVECSDDPQNLYLQMRYGH